MGAWVSCEFVPRAIGGDAGIFEHKRGGAKGAGFAWVVRHEEDGCFARVGLGADFGEQLGFEREVEAGKWFVEQEQVWLCGDGASEGDALLLADGECAGAARGEFADQWPDASLNSGGIPAAFGERCGCEMPLLFKTAARIGSPLQNTSATGFAFSAMSRLSRPVDFVSSVSGTSFTTMPLCF